MSNLSHTTILEIDNQELLEIAWPLRGFSVLGQWDFLWQPSRLCAWVLSNLISDYCNFLLIKTILNHG